MSEKPGIEAEKEEITAQQQSIDDVEGHRSRDLAPGATREERDSDEDDTSGHQFRDNVRWP